MEDNQLFNSYKLFSTSNSTQQPLFMVLKTGNIVNLLYQVLEIVVKHNLVASDVAGRSIDVQNV